MFRGYFRWLESLHIGIEAEKSFTLMLCQVVLNMVFLIVYAKALLWVNGAFLIPWLIRYHSVRKALKFGRSTGEAWLESAERMEKAQKEAKRESLVGLFDRLCREGKEKLRKHGSDI